MNLIDLFGNLSSLVILISLTMSSIVKLRWINMVGAIMFTMFGYMINSSPVMFLNFGIVLIDMYYLYKLYTTKESFKLVEATPNSPYLNHFIEVNKKELEEFQVDNSWSENKNIFYMLRDNNTAGIFSCRNEGEGNLFIDLDFVTPKYRDLKLGKYFFQENKQALIEKGYKKLVTKGNNHKHREYLVKVGFKHIGEDLYEKQL